MEKKEKEVMDQNVKEQELTWGSMEKFFATEVIEQSKRSSKRWFIAWLVTFLVLVGMIAYLVFGYDYVVQDGNGINNFNTEISGEVSNGTDYTD